MKRNIKLTLLNGDIIRTPINGTEEEIIQHYRDNNFFKSCTHDEILEQVESLEFLDASEIDPHCSSIVYRFIDYGNCFYE